MPADQPNPSPTPWTISTTTDKPPTRPQPSTEQLAEWMNDGGCEALDGCWVEPDGHCPHGSPSWMLHLGLI